MYSDVNECDSNTPKCHTNAICTNTIGSYDCHCNTGYVGNGTKCDFNECDSNNHSCHVNAICSNTFGSYNCDCTTGYIGNGTTCQCKIYT